ncbi:MAG: xanthine dehydrogenase family protein subunit M [Gemmatimonadetes bacterium]|nr:xanthine dehydrogenase family protein subunit M [Gemmatimonadota bacterium]
MIPAAFEYTRARSVADALKALGARNTKVLCGGQSLIPLLRFRLAEPKRLVGIGHLSQLKGITRTKGGVRIGAATTYRELLESKVLQSDFPLIGEVTAHIGDLQVRNVGTIGGGLAHADPAADMPAVMLALDAKFQLQSAKGKRTVAAREFFRGPFSTAMKPTELLTEIQLPALPANAGTAYADFEQLASGYALVGAAAVVARSQGSVTQATLAFTGLSDTPFLAKSAGELIGTKGDAQAITRVAEGAVEGVEANDDIHASSAYRLHLAKVAARRALTEAVERAK